MTNKTNIPTFFEERKFIANEFAKWILTQQSFITPMDTETLHRFKDGVYVPDGVVFVKKFTEATLGGKSISTRSINEVVGHIIRKTYIERGEIDSDADIINVKNGVLNTKTFEFSDHSPDEYHTIQIPTKYDPDADCPEFKKFLSEIMKNNDEKNTIQELFGYCLTKSYYIQKWFMFLGNGANGKSVLLTVLKAFLGQMNISNVELQNFENKFAVAELNGKLANIVSDLSAKELYYSGKLKSLTGGDLLMAEKKFENPFSFVSHAKLIYSANRLPKTVDDTFAFWRRVMIINFVETFTGKDDIKDLASKLTTEDELSGILNFAIEGLQRLSINSDFSKKSSVEEIKEFYTKNSNSTMAFFVDRVEITNSTSDVISLHDLHGAFVEYCRKNQFPDDSLKKFNSEIRKEFNLKESRERIGEDNTQTRVWQGIVLFDDLHSNILPFSCDKRDGSDEGKGKIGKGECEIRTRDVSSLGSLSSQQQIMDTIQKKISEYRNESDHAYNVIEAILEEDNHPIDEIEYCIKLYKQGHRIYIPQKEV